MTMTKMAGAATTPRASPRRRALSTLLASLLLVTLPIPSQPSSSLFALGLSVIAPFPSRLAAASAVASALSPVVLRSTASDEPSSSEEAAPAPAPHLKVAVVGAGPSGLLLAHRLLSSPSFSASVSVYESRPDPRDADVSSLKGRAYALGLNGRTRSAIRSVDDRLWEAVRERGFESDRFNLHVGPKIRLKLRDGMANLPSGFRDPDEPPLEPSVLIYQSDLCAALLDEMGRRYGDGGGLELRFGSRVSSADLKSNTLAVQRGSGSNDADDDSVVGPFDLVAGCGGVNSPVRAAMTESSPPGTFECKVRTLPGTFKVARLPSMPPKIDPQSVALLLPGGGGGKKKEDAGEGETGKRKKKSTPSTTTAFVEPVRDGGACILFAGRGGPPGEDGVEGEEEGDPLLAAACRSIDDGDAVGSLSRDVLDRFPLLEGIPPEDLDSMVRQLLTQRPAVASSVKCNVYHYASAALCGDAAHATGGVSGQGVNSAFVDSKVLADCLDLSLSGIPPDDADAKEEAVQSALLSYSQLQVPEGLALYDLSFGAEGELPLLTRLRVLLANARDTLFGGRFGIGRPLLQVQLSSTLRPFADIRRERAGYYGEEFPDKETWAKKIAGIYRTEA